MKKFIKITSLLLILILSLSMIFACSPDAVVEDENNETDIPEQLPEKEEEEKKENQILGKEGNIKFDFVVTHADGSKVTYKVETTKDNLADALLEGSIAKGEEGEFGIYFTEIDGEEASFEKDQSYWYFYKDGEPLMTGASTTPIANGDKFEAIYTK